jgi:rod shape-determining protein MreD
VTALRIAKVTFVGFLAVALQVSVAAQLPISGAMVDVILIATIAAGLAAGPEAGAGVGFACGLVIDLLGVGPVGMTALVYTLIGYGVGVSQIGVLRTSRLIPWVSATIAAPVAVFAYAWIGEVLGQHLFTVADVPTVAVVATVSTAVLCLPARAAMAWAFAEDDARRIQGIGRW